MSGFDLRDGVALGAGLLLVAASFGEGGGSVTALAIWHGALALLLVAAAFARWERGPAAAPLAVWLGFVVLAVVGAAFAPYRYLAALNLLEIFWLSAFGMLAARVGARRSAAILDLLRLAAVGHAIVACVQQFQGVERPASTFLNPNHFGGWVVAVLLLNLDRWLDRDTARGERTRSVIALGACAIAVLLSGSRGAWLGLAVGGGWLAFRRFGGLAAGARRRLLIGAAAILVLGLWSQADRLRESDPFRYNRIRIWSATAAMTAESPWLGSGPGQFEFEARRFQFADDNGPLRFDRSFSRPHSDLLRLFSEYGIPAGLLGLVAVALLVRHVRRSRREELLEAAEFRGADHGPVTALLGIAAQALVDHPSEWPALALLAAWLCGRAISMPRSPGGDSIYGTASPRVLAATVLIWIYLIGDLAPMLAHRAVPWEKPGASQAWSEGLERASARCPMRADLRRLQAENRLQRAPRMTPEIYAAAREEIESAIRLSPLDFTHYWALARLEGAAAETLFEDPATRERSAAAFDRARSLHPTEARVTIDAGRHALRFGERVRARRLAEQAISMEPNAVPAMLLMADLHGSEPWLQQAEETSRRYSARAQGLYAREMLGFDRDWAEQVRRRIGSDR